LFLYIICFWVREFPFISSRWDNSLLADPEQQVDLLRVVVPWVSVNDRVDLHEVAVVLVGLWDRCHECFGGLEGRSVDLVQRLDVHKIFLQEGNRKYENTTIPPQNSNKKKPDLVAHATGFVKVSPVDAMVGHLSKVEGLLSTVRPRLVQSGILKFLAAHRRGIQRKHDKTKGRGEREEPHSSASRKVWKGRRSVGE